MTRMAFAILRECIICFISTIRMDVNGAKCIGGMQSAKILLTGKICRLLCIRIRNMIRMKLGDVFPAVRSCAAIGCMFFIPGHQDMETCWYSRSVWRIQMTGLNLKNTAEIRSCAIRRLMKGRSLTFGIRK